jgi:hypothetical protein
VERLISVLRRPQTIVALVSAPTGDAGAPYSERVIPLSTISESICPWRDKDVKAWRALARVPNLSPRAGLAIVRALIGSVVDPDVEPPAPTPLDAAPPLDLRPNLCSPAGERALIERMGQSLEAATSDVDFPDWHWRRRDQIAELPRGFRRYLLWGLHLSPWERVVVTLGIYDRLALDEAPALLLATARLLSLADRPTGIAWCEVIDRVAPPDRARVAAMIAESGAHAARPTGAVADLMEARQWADAIAELRALVASS